MDSAAERGFRALTLCDRAYAYLIANGATTQDHLLAHVYGGVPPGALQQELLRPLLSDARIERQASGQ
jgi:hypothetical protein